jgi:adenosylhomocysteine nucleosidase
MHEIGIIAALPREVAPLIRHWRGTERGYAGRQYRVFESGNAVLVCGGIGAEAARRATDALIALFQPALICSVGFAGALDPGLKVGEVFNPRVVIDAADGSRVDTGRGEGVLVTFHAIASPQQKAKLAECYAAQAVDMEAAAVARAAAARGVAFTAVKVISDDDQFTFPAMEKFIRSSGEFREGKFAFFVIVRPWLWRAAIRLAGNSRRASVELCRGLEHLDELVQPGSKSTSSISSLETSAN